MKTNSLKVCLLAMPLWLQLAYAEDIAPTQPVPLEIEGYKATIAVGTGRPDFISLVGSPIEATGTAAEITQRANACAAKILKLEPRSKAPLIELSQPDSGLMVGNIYRIYWDLLDERSVRSKVVIEAKEGRFRVTLNAPESNLPSSGYAPVFKIWGTGWERALKELIAEAAKLSACIKDAPTDSW